MIFLSVADVLKIHRRTIAEWQRDIKIANEMKL